MPYVVGLKAEMARRGIGRPTVGGGGPFINPRAPGARTVGFNFQPPAPLMVGRRANIASGLPFYTGRGDPGIFGAIGKFVGGVAKTVGKAALKIGTSALRATPVGSFVSDVISSTRIGAPQSRTITATTGGGPTLQLPPGLQLPMDFGGPQEMPTVSTAGGGTAVALCAPAGYHLNKSGYWKSDSDLLPGASWHPKGTVLVKNRHRNPFNPVAASRAMARLGSLYKAMKVLDKQMAKVARGAGVSRSKGHSGKACGCSAGRKGR